MVKVRVCVCSPTLLCEPDQCMKYTISVNNAADIISLFLVCTSSTPPISSTSAAVATTPLVTMVTSSLWLVLLQQHYRMKRSLYYFFEEVNMTNAILLKWVSVTCDRSISGCKSVGQKEIYGFRAQTWAYCQRTKSSELSITCHWLLYEILYCRTHCDWPLPFKCVCSCILLLTLLLCNMHIVSSAYIKYSPAICLFAFNMTCFKRHRLASYTCRYRFSECTVQYSSLHVLLLFMAFSLFFFFVRHESKHFLPRLSLADPHRRPAP